MFFKLNKDKLDFEDFEIIKKLGEGNFTEVYKVMHKRLPDKYFALKTCCMQKVSSLRREPDIILEKHSLNKIYAAFKDDMPCVKLYTTFKDESNLYFVTELLD